jgi:hypothetical protein
MCFSREQKEFFNYYNIVRKKGFRNEGKLASMSVKLQKITIAIINIKIKKRFFNLDLRSKEFLGPSGFLDFPKC